MHLSNCFNIDDLRIAAKRKLPRGIFEFVDRGAEDELAMANNCEAFGRWKQKQRVMRDVSARSTKTMLFGKPVDLPIVVAPTGAAGLLWYQGEVELARAAKAAGVPFTVSRGSMTALETVAEEVGGRLWFHLNLFREREFSIELIERARNARYEALVLTVDSVVAPKREYNHRNGFSLPFRPGRRSALDILRHPGWLTRVLGRYVLNGGMPTYENFPKKLRVPVTSEQVLLDRRNDSSTWKDVEFIRQNWTGPFLVKGIMNPEDARLAVGSGADGVIVSNHGGRHLDTSPAPLDVLPAIVEAVGDSATVLMDGGIRRGTDIAKAIALGAKAVQIGRATLYGTAVAGEAGAAKAFDFLRDELRRTMAYLGCNSLAEIDRSTLIAHRD